MESIAAQVDAVLSDARRASIPGAMGDALDRNGAIVASPIAGMRGQTAPSASSLSVAIDGPGLFVLESNGRRVYSRLGDFTVNVSGNLIDGRGRIVLGVSDRAAAIESRGLAPIRIGQNSHFHEFSIDARGVLTGIDAGKREPLARLALAVFPASEHMGRVDETAALETQASGSPRFYFPGESNVGALRSHALENRLVDLEGDLARLWRLRRHGELDAARAFATDACVRDALGLVK